MQTSQPFLWNKNHSAQSSLSPEDAEAVRQFHRTLPDYEPTPTTALPTTAATLGLGAVLVKDESSRLGLPAFKMLGASWAVHRALQARGTDSTKPTLVTATDGNHGRAVARMARLLHLPATVIIPRGVSEKAIALIREEGAFVRVFDVTYDETVRRAAEIAEADTDSILVQDTSWPGYEEIPQWIVDGYATLFVEAAEQTAAMGLGIDLIVVPAGVGSLAHAAVLFARAHGNCQVVTVEPAVAPCISASLATGELTTVSTGTTSMAGLNCGTPAYLAWPDLRSGLAGAATVDETAVGSAMDELAALGVDSGPCGAASFAALQTLAQGEPRESLALTESSTALLLNTEGIGSAR